MKTTKIVPIIGEEYSCDFQRNSHGGKAVGRIEGIVSFIDRKSKDFVAPGSTWKVAITGLYDKYVTVMPLYEMATPKENQMLLENKIAILKVQQYKTKHEKPVRSFTSFQQLQYMK